MKITAIQMNSSQDIEQNLQACQRLVDQAMEDKPDLVVLPEMFASMGMDTMDGDIYREVYGDGTIQNFIAQLAKQYRTWFVAGTMPICDEQSHRAFAASLLFDADGKVRARYDKIHLFDVMVTEQYQESKNITPGQRIVTVDTPFGRLGLAVCYDLRFPELFRAMLQEGVEIFVVPAAFTLKTGQAHWELLLRARAVENICYCVGAAQTGRHNATRETYGHSMIVDPWGKVMTCLEQGEGHVSAQFDRQYLLELRERMPISQHQRITCQF